MGLLDGKVALITGAARGIGKAIALKYASEGADIAFTDIEINDTVTETLEAIRAFGVKAEAYASDASDFEAAHTVVSEIQAEFGRIDILVNVAGVAPKVRNDILEMTEESYDFVMNINTKGTLFLTQLVANEMVKAGVKGSIVNISSMSAYTSSVSRGEYCISKAGVSMITTLFADRLAEYGIMVNEIRPGIIATGMTAKVQEKYDRLIEGGLLPIKRWGQPEDIAAAVWALSSGLLPYVTGQSIDVDGGFHIQRL